MPNLWFFGSWYVQSMKPLDFYRYGCSQLQFCHIYIYIYINCPNTNLCTIKRIYAREFISTHMSCAKREHMEFLIFITSLFSVVPRSNENCFDLTWDDFSQLSVFTLHVQLVHEHNNNIDKFLYIFRRKEESEDVGNINHGVSTRSLKMPLMHAPSQLENHWKPGRGAKHLQNPWKRGENTTVQARKHLGKENTSKREREGTRASNAWIQQQYLKQQPINKQGTCCIMALPFKWHS